MKESRRHMTNYRRFSINITVIRLFGKKLQLKQLEEIKNIIKGFNIYKTYHKSHLYAYFNNFF